MVTTLYEWMHWLFSNLCFPWYKWWPEPIGLIPLLIHRGLLQKKNLHPAPLPTPPKEPLEPLLSGRPATGFGTDVNNPHAAAEGSPFGRNCATVPLDERHAKGDPSPQEISQRLLGRTNMKTAFPQFNIIAAVWIQAMVHDWIGHYDDERDPQGRESLERGAEFGCPLQKFKFRKTLERPDDDAYDSFRTMWWDASFVYGDEETENTARTFVGGKLKVDEKNHPNTLHQEPDGSISTGDNKNSWVGVELLQELFLKEHNAVAEEIAKQHPEIAHDDQQLFDKARLVVAALVAKIHTVDWTVELLKTSTLRIGMNANWYGLPRAIGVPKWVPIPPLFQLVGQRQANNRGVPFCLTEEFAAVYRLHPMLPDGLYIDSATKFIELNDLVGEKGQKTLRSDPDLPMKFWDSVLRYPCGALVLQNYPKALRDLAPTDDDGRPLDERIDLAALDIFRDRERGIPRFNTFRKDIGMKPFTNWEELTGGDAEMANLLASVYGEDNIDDCDLLIGNLAEKKIPGFAISETSFVIFLLMASRRLEADPFLNEYFNEETYSSAGLEWIESTNNLRDVLSRHYPDLVKEIGQNQSAFTPRTPWPIGGEVATETTPLLA